MAVTAERDVDELRADLTGWLADRLDGRPVAVGDIEIPGLTGDQRVAAVLDWEMVTAGDPLQDLAWYLIVDRHHHEALGVPRLEGLPDRAASVAHWEAATGRSAEHLGWYEVLGAVRYAAIVTRVLHLLDGTGILPGAAAMAHDHPGLRLLDALLAEQDG